MCLLCHLHFDNETHVSSEDPKTIVLSSFHYQTKEAKENIPVVKHLIKHFPLCLNIFTFALDIYIHPTNTHSGVNKKQFFFLSHQKFLQLETFNTN